MPSCVSFVGSLTVLANIALNTLNHSERFYQLVALFAIFDYIQCFSWFLGPRYETHTTLCKIQEYLFQLGTFMQSIISVWMCAIIFYAIRFGTVLAWGNPKIYRWAIVSFLCLLLSIPFDTAALFCPFDENHSLSYHRLSKSSRDFNRLIVYCCYMLPFQLVLFSSE